MTQTKMCKKAAANKGMAKAGAKVLSMNFSPWIKLGISISFITKLPAFTTPQTIGCDEMTIEK